MPLPTGLRRDSSGIFHLRIGIPEDVRPYWPRRSDGSMAIDAYRRSLKTRDRSVAITVAHGLIAEYQRKFTAIREQHRPQFTRITPKLFEYLTEQIRYSLLQGDDIDRVSPDQSFIGAWSGETKSRAKVLKDAHRLQALSRELRMLHADGDMELTTKFLDLLLSKIGLPPADWTQYPAYVARAGRILAQTFQAIADRASGAIIETPDPPRPIEVAPAPPAPHADVRGATNEEVSKGAQRDCKTLRDAVPHWKLLTEAKRNSIQRMDRALLLWEEAVGVLPITQITRETGADFVAYLLDEDRGFGRKTAKNHADCISALMNVAARKGLIPANPLDLKFSVNGQEERPPWTQAELALLHGQAISGPLNRPGFRGGSTL